MRTFTQKLNQPQQQKSLDITRSGTLAPLLRSSGQPLDTATRVFMESRFSHDFSQVRVHTDAAAQGRAAAEGALAYTAGRDLVFGPEQYQPQTMAGRWVIAHELAHVIQQQGSTPGSGAAEGVLEREAGEAAMRVALGGHAQVPAARGGPAVQFLRVSGGGFGKALEEFTKTFKVENKAITLLQKSTTFMRLADTLDRHYVWSHDPIFDDKKSGSPTLDIDADGRVVKPPSAVGRRSLLVVAGGPAPSFRAFKSPDNLLPADVIALNQNVDTAGFIQEIAHEATHAAASVGAAAPQPQTLVQEINAGIQDEIAARESEKKILGEIPDAEVKANISKVGSTVEREVQRDLSSFNLTYLELFFFDRELRDEQADEGLDDTEARNIQTKVDQNPTVPTVFFRKHKQVGKIVSDYAKTWFDRQTAVREWAEFIRKNPPPDPLPAAEKEKLLQDHAKRFFKGKVSYIP
jgi:hypothetical protein